MDMQHMDALHNGERLPADRLFYFHSLGRCTNSERVFSTSHLSCHFLVDSASRTFLQGRTAPPDLIIVEHATAFDAPLLITRLLFFEASASPSWLIDIPHQLCDLTERTTAAINDSRCPT